MKNTSQEIFVRSDSILKLGQKMNISLPDDDRTFVTKIEDIFDCSLVLSVPYDEDRCPLIISPGTNLTCNFFDGNSYYKFVVNLERRANEVIPVWHTDKPLKVQKIQHREFVRMKIEQPLVVHLVDEEDTKESMLFTTTVDLSGGGICFLLDKPLEVGKQISVELDDIPGIGLFRSTASVVRYAEFEDNGNIGYHIGAKFTRLNPKIQDKIVNFIFDLQRKASKHTIRH
ncbi:Flagellar protein [Anaerovibrio sp. JC8]|uniref:flagellar brake protein n=1 Tax=Anaerovibrio sp. JC8 TaxID=1240085 RepID=UPI000A0AABC7|nr:PilZ domain-containing protein [Anaerovibrio sp. JC8]ORT99193.1 Flagellar protein [Anaerovibrio sp. JC8]